MKSIVGAPDSPKMRRDAARNFHKAHKALATLVDRIMSALLAFEWVALIVIALVVAPKTWEGSESRMHPHLWMAILAGPAFILPAIALAFLKPASIISRHVIAVAQILVSILLIDITGGRIESHFHVFGSLAILATYRDWPVLLTATTLTAVDHAIRGIWFPQSAYGTLTVSPWRWIEHAAWVVFEDIFLFFASYNSIREMWVVAVRETQLYWGANFDVLTGLANRRLLQERFDKALRQNPLLPKAVLFIDLDRFKQANDTLGHTVGDKLLQSVAERFAATVGAINNQAPTLARIGGDEFVILIDNFTETESIDLGARMLDAVAAPFDIDDHKLMLTASVGISLYPEHGTTLHELQDRADRAMYMAKSLGRDNCTVFSSDVLVRERRLQTLNIDLHDALRRREMELLFQPIVASDHAGNSRVEGFEALLRWQHPIHGEISPAEFIPMAEKSGAIVSLGDWVLAEACRSCREWQSHRESVTGVAVNISGIQFAQLDFAERVIRIIRQTGLDPSLLTIELTESIVIADVALAHQHLAKLRAAGVRVSLDDFGTGYSSLSYLTTLPADSIKLDRSFVQRELAHPGGILDSVIRMAHSIGLSVVMEGVETKTQREKILSMDCDQLQGYYFSPPVPANDVLAMLSQTPEYAGN